MPSRSLDDLFDVLRRLRAPDGCPWDRAQTSESLIPFTLEEVYELADAVQGGDPAATREELGDLLFHLVFHAQLAEESGAFGFDDVARAVTGKLVRRHPGVFERNGDDAGPCDAPAEAREWESRKARELGEGGGTLAGVAATLPALTRAVKLQDRATLDGFDWPDSAGVLGKVDEELAELRSELPSADPGRLKHEIGDVLLAMTNLARHLGVDPESALRTANRRFERRYARMEQIAADREMRLADLGLAELEDLWQQAKRDTGD